MKKPILLGLATVLIFQAASAQFVGVNPSTQDLGTVERGETYEFSIYVDTGSDRLTLEPVTGTDVNVDSESDEVSQEDITSWITFRQDTYESDPSTTVNPPGDAGSATEKIDFFLQVPRDAEPGEHRGFVKFEPVVEDESGAAVNTFTVSQFSFSFRVPGDPRRELQVRGVEAARTDENQVRVDVDVENTGTVTTYINSGDISIADGSGRLQSLSPGRRRIAPGETKTISLYWTRDSGEIQSGQYRLQGTMNYATGSAFVDSSFAVTDFITIRDPGGNSTGILGGGGSGDGSGVPVWAIAMFLVLAGSIMYSFEIDPMLIILALAALAASGFIWFSSLPVQMVGVVLITAAALFYYGWM